MSYKALYRTYRPKSFEEVAGQKHIVRTLKNALNENKIAHAYLFCGPRGTGKTSMARIFAKALNCTEGFGHQCNQCENCIAINEGKHPDVIEIDAASNRGIDDIRDLISKVKYAPIMGKFKIYIIDEVHMMTTEAFNALLKTLEEPPANVVFILATTEPYKLMPTILSRCQRYDFSKVSDGDIYNRLFDICEKEHVTVDEEALSLLVSLADGGVRDALSMLDQTIAYSGSTVTVSAVEELYGLSSVSEKMAFLTALDKGDVLTITNKIHEFSDSGIDIRRLTSDLMELLKELLIYQTTKDDTLLKAMQRSDAVSLSIPADKINRMIDILLETLSQYRLVTNIGSLFEIAMLKIASLSIETKKEETVQIKEKIVYVEKTQEPVRPAKELPPEQPAAPDPKVEIAPPPRKMTEPLVTPTFNSLPHPEPKADPLPPSFTNVSFTSVQPFAEEGTPIVYTMDDILNIMVQATKEAKNNLNQNWHLLDQLLSHNRVGKYAALLKMTAPRIVSKVAVVFESSFRNTVNKMNLKENQIGLSKVIEALSGESCVILCMNQQEFVESVKKFTNMQQINKLPHPKPVEIETRLTSGEKQKSKTAAFADELFSKGEDDK